jgi:small GTP-binding protein
MSTISKKICLVGDFAVGKTSLIRRFVDRQFSDKYLSTVGVKISRKAIDLIHEDPQQKKELQLLIWDIEGSNKFKAIAPTYFQGARGAIIVGDVTQPETLTTITEHVQNFLAVNPQACIVVALNKSDLIETEYLEKIRQMHEYNNTNCVLSTFLTSAKTGKNVDEMFQLLAHSLI